MTTEDWTSRWWETSVVLLAVNSIVFGILAINSDHMTWAVTTGFVPAVLLLLGLTLRNSQRVAATTLLTVASVAAALWFWMIYPIILALVVIVGGFTNGKIGPEGHQPQLAT